MGLKEIFNEQVKDKNRLLTYRYKASIFVFSITTFLFFLNYFFIGVDFYYKIFIILLPYTYILFLLSFLFYTYFFILHFFKISGKIAKLTLFTSLIIIFIFCIYSIVLGF